MSRSCKNTPECGYLATCPDCYGCDDCCRCAEHSPDCDVIGCDGLCLDLAVIREDLA